MSLAWSFGNHLDGLSVANITWSSGYTTNREYLYDGYQDKVALGSSSPAASGQYLQINFGSARTLPGIALLNHNLASGGVAVKVEAADNAGMPTNLVTAKAATTVNTSAPYDRDTLLQFPAVTRQYWRLTFTHSGTKQLQIGELLMLPYLLTLTRNSVYGGHTNNLRSLQRRITSETESVRVARIAPALRTINFRFEDLQGESQRDELLAMWNASEGGAKGNTLLAEYVESSASAGSAASQRCLWGRFQDTWGWSDDDYTVYGATGYELKGASRGVVA